MHFQLDRVAFAACSALAVLGSPASARQLASDPFAAAQRWSSSASTSDAWLPQALTFAARGELVWHAAAGTNPHFALFDGASNSAQPTPWLEQARPGVLGALGVAAGADERALYALAQYPGPSSNTRWTEISRYDLQSSTPDSPLWARLLPLAGNGVARLHAARASAVLAAANYDQASQRFELTWLDAANGAALDSYSVVAATFRQSAASRELDRVAFVVGAQAHVVSRFEGLEHVEGLGGATNALALSGDGARLAVGSGSVVRVLVRGAGGWGPLREFVGLGGEVATRVALSDDGRTLAIGWWDSVVTQRVRFQVWRTEETSPRYERELHSTSTSLQNFPEAVALTPDGRRAAFGAWGTQDSAPEALLVDANSGVELFALDLPGSVRALALDASGTRLALGYKHAHANLIATTGEVASFDTGERDLQRLEPSQAGFLHVAARRAGALRAYFVHGPLASSGTPFGSAAGALWIQRPFAKVAARRTDATGRADLELAPPPGGWGPNFAVQAYFRGGGAPAFTTSVVLPPQL
jgi:hypothetical protein